MVVMPMTPVSRDSLQHSFSHPARRAICAVGLLVGLGGLVPAGTAEEASIRQLMTPEQFRAAGLDKLTEEELRTLDTWLRGQQQPTLITDADDPAPAIPRSPPTQPMPSTAPAESTEAVAANAENFGLPEPSPAEKDEGKTLRATIVSPFRGWTGKTRFKLDNGQIWQQRVSGRYTYGGDDARVEITVNGFGFYEMELLDAGRSVGVKRIQ